jgi:NADH:ubiquinone reductase (H+-translocating)
MCLATGAVVGLVVGLLVQLVQVAQDMTGMGYADGFVDTGPTEPALLFMVVVLSVLVGVGIGATVGYRPRGHAAATGSGLLIGLLVWVAESLTLLPLLAGQAVTWSIQDAEATFPFLIGRMLFGALTGLGTHQVLATLLRSQSPSTQDQRPAPGYRVVILGGGFAGVTVARRLEHRLARRTDVEIVLVSDGNYLLFTPMLVGVAAGTLQARHISAPLRACCPRTVCHRARVESVDLARQQVWLRRGDAGAPQPMHYDQLVLALGATANYRGLPGVAEHGFALKTLEDATRLRNHVIGMLERADVEPDPTERERQLTFVVAGGGFAGAELIAELFDMVHDVRRYYPHIEQEWLRFVLVHAQDRILPELPRGLADHSLAELRARGIEFLLPARLAGATADSVLLDDGRRLGTRTVVWTAGNQPNPLVATLPVPLVRGAVSCEPTLRVRGLPNVWALGDCAAVPDVLAPGEFHPPTAQHALRQGKVVGDNLVATLDGRRLDPFEFRTIGLLVSLGHQKGAAQFRGRPYSGLFAWLLWRGVYLVKLPGLEKKVRVVLDWLLDLFFPRDVVLTEPADPTPDRSTSDRTREPVR